MEERCEWIDLEGGLYLLNFNIQHHMGTLYHTTCKRNYYLATFPPDKCPGCEKETEVVSLDDMEQFVHICHYKVDDSCYYSDCGREFFLNSTNDLPIFCDKCGGLIEEVSEDACCINEKRNINGGCNNCGDPCL